MANGSKQRVTRKCLSKHWMCTSCQSTLTALMAAAAGVFMTMILVPVSNTAVVRLVLTF